MNPMPNKALPAGVVSIAALDLVSVTVEKLLNRQAGLPGIGVLYGPPGRGKSMAAGAMVVAYRAYYIQVAKAWGVKTLLQKILLEMGAVIPKRVRSTSDLLDLVTLQLAASRRPLILDEADRLTGKEAMIETVRDIYEQSRAPILLVGSEDLRTELRAYPTTHSRVHAWVSAQPVTFDDAQKLATVYASGIRIAPDLLAEIVDRVGGSVRYTCVNLARVLDEALVMGDDEMNLAKWGSRPIYNDDTEGEA